MTPEQWALDTMAIIARNAADTRTYVPTISFFASPEGDMVTAGWSCLTSDSDKGESMLQGRGQTAPDAVADLLRQLDAWPGNSQLALGVTPRPDGA
jgi:hypothetical protein